MLQLVEMSNAFGRWLVGQLWQMSIELAILAGVVLAVLYLLRVKSPTLRHAFWCLVLAKPVVTFLIASPVSLYWFLRPTPEPVQPAVVAPAPPANDAPAYIYRHPMVMRPAYRAVPPVAPIEPPAAWRQLDSHGAAGLAWSATAFALFLRLVIGCAYVAFLRQTSTTQSEGPLPELVDEVARAFKIRRRVAVAISDVPHGPVLAGILYPMILLPRRLVEMMSVEQTRLILAHEMAHVRRRDNLLLLIQRLAEMFLFFHPVVWVCGWILRREAEAACDDAVIAAYGGSTAYADSLTRVAEMKCGLTRRLLVNTFAAAESNFSQRVRRILDERVGRMRLGLSVAAVVALVVVACFGLPTASARKAALEGTDEEAAMQKEGQDASKPIEVAKLTDAQKERLLQWQNMFGWSLEKCVQGAERTPLIRELLAEELLLGALSDDAQVIRQAMTGLEPADLTYWGKVEGVVSAIGTHPLPEGSVKDGRLVLPLPGWEQRKEEVARQVKAMQLWSAGTPLVEARKDAASDAAIVEVVYGLLGDPNATKRRLVRLAIEKLTDDMDLGQLEAMGKDEKLKGFVHRLEMLDIQLWSHDRNFKILLGDIGRGKVTGDWHEPGGPLAWYDGDPADAPKVAAAAEALETWLDGGRSDQEFAQGLGRPDAYKEKVWLVRCLLAYLRDHQGAYYPIGERRAQDTSAPTPNGSVVVRREGHRVWIEGVPRLKQSDGKACTFAGALEVTLAVTAHPYSYVDIMGLTALAFRVRWSNEDTKTKWCGSCAIGEMPDELTDVGRLTGWALPTDTQFGEDQADTDAIRRKIVTSIDAGRPVMAYASCLEMAVIYGYADGGGTLLVSDYRIDQPFRLPAEKIGPLQTYLGDRTEPPSRRDALIEALKTAVVNWRRQRHDGGIEGREYFYGDAALHAWLQDLSNADDLPKKKREVFFRLNNWNYRSLKDARAAASAFLEEHASLLGDETRTALGRAAELYQDELDDLERREKTHRSWSVESVDAWTDQIRKGQRESLLAVRRKEAEAIAEIEKALAAEGIDVSAAIANATASVEAPTAKASRPPSANAKAAKAKVRKKGERVIIPNVPRPKGLNSTLASLASILESIGEDVTYEHLMGVSSHAFRLQFAWCPSNPHSHVGFNTFKPALEAIGYEATELPVAEFEGQQPKAPAEAKLEKVRRAVRASIDEGVPVLFGSEECGVIAGYGPVGADDKTGWLRRPGPIGGPPKADEPYVEPIDGRPWGIKGVPWAVQVLSRAKSGRPPQKERVVWSVKTAVENAHRGDVNGLAIGFAAWDKWIAELKDFAKPQRETKQALAKQNRPHSDADVLSSLCIGNAWCFESLIEARRAAATYLRSIDDEVGKDGAKHLQQAAEHYDALVGVLTKERPTDVAPYPWMLKGEQKWTAAMRRQQATSLGQALAFEKQAIAEIEKALAEEGIDVQRVAARPYPESALLKNVPGGAAHYDTFVGGLAIALSQSGIPTDYDTLVGDLGTAFLLQASDRVARFNGALDAGWWPLAWDCLPVLLEEVAPTLGVKIEWVGGDVGAYKADPAQYYRDNLAGTVKASIAQGRPALENHGFWEVVVGYDGNEPPLLGFCPRSDDRKPNIKRLEKYPVLVAALGSAVPRLARKTADLEALERAVALGRDQIPMPNGYRTGQRAFALWADTLRDTEHLGQARWHANVVGHLNKYRRSAVAYLRAMAERHSEKTASHLKAAANSYEKVLGELKRADTSEDALIESKQGREALARLAERIAALEVQAIAEIEKALVAEGIEVEAPKAAAETSARPVVGAKQLQGLEQKRMWVTHIGCLIGCAEYLKMDASPGWIWGASGHAFALNVHEVICPSGPTAWPAEKCDRLAANVGVQIEDLRAHKRDEDFAKKQAEIWAKTRQAIDAGLPCFGWELGVPDWYVITGYDADGHYLFTEFDGKPAKKDYTKLGDSKIGVACVLVVKPGKAKPDRTAVREALVFALDHAAGKHSHDVWHTGLSGYDTWVKALQDDKRVKEEEVIGFGHAYNAACWAECRKHAVAFLEEAKKRLDDKRLSPQFDEAIKHYKIVSASLDAVAKAFPFNVRDQKRMRERIKDAARRAKAIKTLQTAREAERAGLKALARIAVSLGAKGVDPDAVGAQAAPSARSSRRSQVVLKDVVKAFKDAQKVASHQDVSRPTKVYPQPSAYLYTHYVCMRAAGWDDVDFDRLAAVSGSSALFAYDPTTLMPKYANLHIDIDRRITEVTGFGFEWVKFTDAEDAWRIITETIDSGRPVKAPHYEDAIFAGYQNADRPEDRKILAMGDPFPDLEAWWSWKEFGDWEKAAGTWNRRQLGRHTKRVRKTAAKTVAIRVLRDLVTWSGKPPAAVTKAFPKATFGLAGIDAYARDVGDFRKKPEKYFKDTSWCGCHGINPQWTVRNATAVYLERLAGTTTFGKKVNEHLAAAAKQYQATYAGWQAFYQQLGHGAPKDAWNTKTRRTAGAAAVREALEHEKAGVQEIRLALAAAGVKVASASTKR